MPSIKGKMGSSLANHGLSNLGQFEDFHPNQIPRKMSDEEKLDSIQFFPTNIFFNFLKWNLKRN